MPEFGGDDFLGGCTSIIPLSSQSVAEETECLGYACEMEDVGSGPASLSEEDQDITARSCFLDQELY